MKQTDETYDGITAYLGLGRYITCTGSTVCPGLGRYITCLGRPGSGPEKYPVFRIKKASENVEQYIGGELPEDVKSSPFINIAFLRGECLYNTIKDLLCLCRYYYPLQYEKLEKKWKEGGFDA